MSQRLGRGARRARAAELQREAGDLSRCATPTAPARTCSRATSPTPRTVLVANPQLVGTSAATSIEAVYVVIQSDATRLAALVSGDVDFVIDPPFQDVPRLKAEGRFKLAQISDIGMQYIGFDQSRERAGIQRCEGPQSVQGPARAPRGLSGDRHRRDRLQGAARTGDRDGRVPVDAGRRLDEGARSSSALRSRSGAKAPEGGRLPRAASP